VSSERFGLWRLDIHHTIAGPDYLREVYALYRALAEILNLGVDFLDEDELLVPASLAKFKVCRVF
jgi:hypothetical protein